MIARNTSHPPLLGLATLLVLPLGLTAQGGSIPTPESSLGFSVGADFKLATYEESLNYFRTLESASDRLRLFETGRTSEGRPWYFAAISTPENLERLDRYREISLALAHPGDLTDDLARVLAREGKAIVHIDGGLHATEVAGAQHTIQLAYDLLAGAESDARISNILDNVVVLLWPSLNPDGQDMVAEWYLSNVGTPYEVAPMPRLYQKYIGHDNNRDAYMLNMVESRMIARTWSEWEPQIVYVHHQSSPFPTRIWLPPFAEPITPQAPPIMSRTVNVIGMTIAQALEERGMDGATHMGTGFDAWYPGYIDYLPILQHRASFWTETALYRYATPKLYTISDFPEDRSELRAETLYPSPWKGGWWRLRDAVDYMRTASMAVLDYAARYKEELLYNRYQSGRNTIQRYREEPPFGYLIRQDQRDPVAAVELLRRLAFNGIRVTQLSADTEFQGMDFAAGTWVIPMDQEFAELVRQLLDVQAYPDLREYPDGPPEQPYDAAGWTLSDQMGVRVIAAAEPLSAELRAAMEPVVAEAVDWRDDSSDASSFDMVGGPGFDTSPLAAGIVPPEGRITGSGSSLAVDPAENNAFRLVNRAWAAGARVRFEAGRAGTDGGPGSSGRYVISGASGNQQSSWVRDLALRAERTGDRGTALQRPRVGLYRPTDPSMDEGWTRWLLERYEFEFGNVSNADFQAGEFERRFDVIVLPAERARRLMDGFRKGSVPPRYEGGIGDLGVRALQRFVTSGGTLIAMNQSSDLVIRELNLPVENAVGELGREEFFARGSILEVITDPSHPVMSGMPERAPVFVDNSPVFRTLEGFQGSTLAKYQEQGSALRSGYLLGEEHLQGLAAALDVRYGDGRVILLGFRPQWRGQPFGTFRVLFNALLFHGEVADGVVGTPGF